MSVPFDHAEAYRAAGWSGTLAFEPREKWPPPPGFTGYDGRWPSPADMNRWRAEGRANIGIRLPRGVIGIDVDCYGGKPGAETQAELELRWGKLPPTWASTSRTDGSRILMFRYSHRDCPVPDDAWSSVAGAAIEILRYAHRYAMVWPSIHPEGGTYRWLRPDGTEAAEGEIPSPGDLAELPASWLTGLTGVSPNGTKDPGHVRPGSRADQRAKLKPARTWIKKLPSGEPCGYVGRLAADALAGARREHNSAYEDTRDAVLALLRAAEIGHPGVVDVLARVKDEYVAVVAEKRGGEMVARGEFDRFTEFGAAKILAEPGERAGGGCDCDFDRAGIVARRDVVEPKIDSCSIDHVLNVFRTWLHLPDPMPVYAALGCIAANRLPGDPVWLGIVAPPSSAKTEVLNATTTLPDVHPAATLTPAALLSGTPQAQRAKDAKGGLLRQIGERGILLMKDFGSVLSMRPEAKAEVLAALREIYDGSWTRHLGTDGGRRLHWAGKMGLVFGATPVLDSHHSVLGAMGERFILMRMEAGGSQQLSRALDHAGAKSSTMRQELAAAVAGLFAGDGKEPRALSQREKDELIAMATLHVRIRSTVERDRQSREIESIHGAEGPARLGLTLERLLAGLDTIGVNRTTAFDVVRRVARDSVPPLRRWALDHLVTQDNPVETKAIAEKRGLPTVTMRRVLEDLAAYGLVIRHGGGQGKADLWSANPEPIE